MSTIRERLKNNAIFEAYGQLIKEQQRDIQFYQKLLNKTMIIDRIGREGKFGEIYQGKISDNLVAIKKIPLRIIDLELFLTRKHFDKNIIYNENTVWREIYLLKICSKLLKSKKSINLPFFHFFLYTSSNHWNKELSKNLPYIYTFSELANEDLKSWSRTSHGFAEWKSCILQIFFSIFCLQYYCGFLHNDLHWGNVLVSKVKKGGYWVYNIHHKEYYIKNEGYLFMIWDFGFANLHPELVRCKEYDKSCHDFLKILNTPKWINKYFENVKVPSGIVDFCLNTRSIKFKSMNELLNLIISKWAVKTDNDFILETFHL